MVTKKHKKRESGRPENWREICMRRVPPWTGKLPEPKKAEKPKSAKK